MAEATPTDKLAAIITALEARTAIRSIHWVESDFTDVFVTSLAGGLAVELGPTTFKIRDENGNILDQSGVNDPMFAETPAKATLWTVIPRLHELVRRQALQVDEKLDRLLGELGS